LERAVITVMGYDQVGIVAEVTKILAASNCNIVDITQTLMQGIFAMIILINLPVETDLTVLREKLLAAGERMGIQITIQHEDIYRYMHRI
jgi:ACT domain-containing protein